MKTFSKEYHEVLLPKLQKELGIKNALATPRMTKLIVNIGLPKGVDDKDREDILKMLTMITGQKPEGRKTTKNIQAFKIRVGMVIGQRVTLRGARMEQFFAKFIKATLPRMRDFRGIPLSCVGHDGSLNIGIREHIIFPELIGEDFRRIWPLQVIVVAKAKSREEGIALWRALGVPFEREEK